MQPRKPENSAECHEVLSFLDYLRKSQCTSVVFAENRMGHQFMTQKNIPGCHETLTEMEKVVKECYQLSRPKK